MLQVISKIFEKHDSKIWNLEFNLVWIPIKNPNTKGIQWVIYVIDSINHSYHAKKEFANHSSKAWNMWCGKQSLQKRGLT